MCSGVSNVLVLTEGGNPDKKQALLQGSGRLEHHDGAVSLFFAGFFVSFLFLSFLFLFFFCTPPTPRLEISEVE